MGRSPLLARRNEWIALGPVVEALAFDFADWRTNMAPAEMPLRLPIDHNGVWNAVAFWFELELDEESSLSTSPYADKARRFDTPKARKPADEQHWLARSRLSMRPACNDAAALTAHCCGGVIVNQSCV